MLKVAIAFFLGVFGLFVGFGVGEGSGLVAGCVALGAYFCLCQFLLSRKNANAYRKDWPAMLALDATWLGLFLVKVLKEGRDVNLSQGPRDTNRQLRGTYLGAVVASLAARRTMARS